MSPSEMIKLLRAGLKRCCRCDEMPEGPYLCEACETIRGLSDDAKNDPCDKNSIPGPTDLKPSVFPYYGWLCPRCGRGNAPHASNCPCVPQTWTITCSDSTKPYGA